MLLQGKSGPSPALFSLSEKGLLFFLVVFLAEAMQQPRRASGRQKRRPGRVRHASAGTSEGVTSKYADAVEDEVIRLLFCLRCWRVTLDEFLHRLRDQPTHGALGVESPRLRRDAFQSFNQVAIDSNCCEVLRHDRDYRAT